MDIYVIIMKNLATVLLKYCLTFIIVSSSVPSVYSCIFGSPKYKSGNPLSSWQTFSYHLHYTFSVALSINLTLACRLFAMYLQSWRYFTGWISQKTHFTGLPILVSSTLTEVKAVFQLTQKWEWNIHSLLNRYWGITKHKMCPSKALHGHHWKPN